MAASGPGPRRFRPGRHTSLAPFFLTISSSAPNRRRRARVRKRLDFSFTGSIFFQDALGRTCSRVRDLKLLLVINYRANILPPVSPDWNQKPRSDLICMLMTISGCRETSAACVRWCRGARGHDVPASVNKLTEAAALAAARHQTQSVHSHCSPHKNSSQVLVLY